MPSPVETDDLFKLIDRLPFFGSVKRDVAALRRLLYDRRPPRIAALGLPASGRTSLANALLNAAAFGPRGAAPLPPSGSWFHIDAAGRRLDWLELDASLERDALLASSKRALDERTPDLVVVVVNAKTVANDAKRLLAALPALREELRRRAKGDPPGVLVIATHADELRDTNGGSSDADLDPMIVAPALAAVRHALSDANLPDEAFLGVAAHPRGPRWNVDAVAEAIVDRLPEPAQLEAVRAFDVGRDTRRRIGRALVNSASALAVTVGLAPIPFADVIVLLPLQAAMVSGIAYLSGRAWDGRAAGEWIASLGVAGGAGLGLRWAARELVKLIPGAGTIVGASIAGTGTLAMGRSAMAYFIDGPGRAAPRSELYADAP